MVLFITGLLKNDKKAVLAVRGDCVSGGLVLYLKKCSSELILIIFSGAGALSGPVFRSISNILQNSPLFHSGIRLLPNDTALSDLLGRACLLFHGAMLLFTVHAGSLIGRKRDKRLR